MTDTNSPSVAPLLTIAIPTYNRAGYLAENLAQLRSELAGVTPGLVELVVSDNCSTDTTGAIVQEAIGSGLPIRYVRNEKNLGWALNFAQAFDIARGKYVLLLGDDDLFVDGALSLLLNRIGNREYGVVCVRPYGFDSDFRKEHPGGSGRELAFRDPNAFLIAISRYFTLTSACVVNKSLIKNVDPRQFVMTDLATFHLLLRAALVAPENLYIQRYLVASKRQNSFSYDYADVFVGQLWRILDAHVPFGLAPATIRRLERDKLLSYYPFYMLDLRLSGRSDMKATRALFEKRFGDRRLYNVWLAPIAWLPRPLAILWGATATVVGRIAGGELRRGARFAMNRVARVFRS